jgi:hypothetical protein
VASQGIWKPSWRSQDVLTRGVKADGMGEPVRLDNLFSHLKGLSGKRKNSDLSWIMSQFQKS